MRITAKSTSNEAHTNRYRGEYPDDLRSGARDRSWSLNARYDDHYVAHDDKPQLDDSGASEHSKSIGTTQSDLRQRNGTHYAR